MKEPVWIEKVDCLETLNEMTALFGGLTGVRDEGLLDSAIARPKQAFYYGQEDLFQLAALYAHGLVKNHPFLDGNKRVGFMMAALFLESNGYIIQPLQTQATERTLALASGEIESEVFAKWLRESCTPQA